MELRQIYYFLAVARHLNFTLAARECFVTQSTLSEQIRNLEREFDCLLFERTSKKVHLTMEGELFRTYGEQVIQHIEEAKASIGKNHSGITGKIRFGALPTVMLSWLPLLILEFKKDFPHVQFVMKEYGSSDIEQSLNNYLIDFGITNLPPKDPSLHSTVLYEENLVLIIPQQHRLTSSSKRTLQFEDFKDEPLIIYEEGYDLREIILNAFFEAGYSPNIVIENGRTESIKYLVQCGLGVALIPEIAVYYRTQKKELHWFHVEPEIVRPVGLVTRKYNYRSSFLEEFISRLSKYKVN